MNTLEYVADAIMKFEGWAPGTLSYTHRNPGNLTMVDSLSGRIVYQSFNSLLEGYSALLKDLEGKFTGKNRHELGPKSTLYQLMSIYSPPPENPTDKYAQFLADWLSKCLKVPVTQDTLLETIWASTS